MEAQKNATYRMRVKQFHGLIHVWEKNPNYNNKSTLDSSDSSSEMNSQLTERFLEFTVLGTGGGWGGQW